VHVELAKIRSNEVAEGILITRPGECEKYLLVLAERAAGHRE